MKTFKYFTEAKMSRQHFQFIADVIASLELMKSNKELVARKFAIALESTNPGFKADTFMKAYKKSPGWIGPQGDSDSNTGRSYQTKRQ